MRWVVSLRSGVICFAGQSAWFAIAATSSPSKKFADRQAKFLAGHGWIVRVEREEAAS